MNHNIYVIGITIAKFKISVDYFKLAIGINSFTHPIYENTKKTTLYTKIKFLFKMFNYFLGTHNFVEC